MKTIAQQLAEIKNVSVSDILILDTAENVNLFQLSKGWYGFELTKTGKVVKNSVKYVRSVESYNNCSY